MRMTVHSCILKTDSLDISRCALQIDFRTALIAFPRLSFETAVILARLEKPAIVDLCLCLIECLAMQ